LKNATSLDYPRDLLEIVVASDGSNDGTVAIARSFESQGVQLLPFSERRGKASVVNDAVQASRGEVVCLCDANVMFHPDALNRLVGRLADPSVGAVSGNVRLASHESNFGEGESLYYRIDRAIQVGESRIGSMLGVDGGMYALRKSLFRPLPADTILDDFVTTIHVIQQGWRVAYEIADENGTPSARQEFRRRVRISSGAVQSLKRRQWPPLSQPIELWQYASHKLLRWAGPGLLGIVFIGSLLLWNAGAIYRIALIAQLAVGLLAVGAWVSVPFRETRVGGVPFYFVMSHVAMALGTVLGIFNRQRVTWTKTGRKPTSASAHAA
jgi:cellulose synthase/poly-beta-1,6-N-acetylglucosamine synthase-like glycosyltransferase